MLGKLEQKFLQSMVKHKCVDKAIASYTDEQKLFLSVSMQYIANLLLESNDAVTFMGVSGQRKFFES